MNFITLKELKKMVPVASEFKRVPGLKKILEDGIEVILRKQMENHAEVVVYKNGYVSYHAHERYTVFALHNCTHYYYESQGNEHQTIPHDHFEDMEWHIRLVLEGEDRLVRNIEARESETFSYAADVNPEYNNEMEDPRINVMDFVLNLILRSCVTLWPTMKWNWICWEIAARPCLLSFPTRTIRSISWCPSCTPSFSIYFVTVQTINAEVS